MGSFVVMRDCQLLGKSRRHGEPLTESDRLAAPPLAWASLVQQGYIAPDIQHESLAKALRKIEELEARIEAIEARRLSLTRSK